MKDCVNIFLRIPTHFFSSFIGIFTVLAILSLSYNLSYCLPEIPADKILSDNDLLNYIKNNINGLHKVYVAKQNREGEKALNLLAMYFKQKAGERYYFNWHNFKERFDEYSNLYPKMRQKHEKLAKYHITTFSPETKWELPFKNRRGEEVSAYELRHLARQQKSFDMALSCYYRDGDSSYFNYFIRQVADLNRAFEEGEYDNGGNAIYESFRAGKRIHNWLFCYNAYQSLEQFDWEKQILLIKTFLHHGAQLQKRTKKNRYGNHHTKGLVALFEIASQFKEFEGCELWLDQALSGLVWHLENEINQDGFQFERSVHYHKGDIENYLRIYLLAKRNNIELPDVYKIQFQKLFDVLVQLAQPDGNLPVLQDDTDNLLQEYNEIDDVMMVGSIVFQNPEYKYFAGDAISPSYYWFFNEAEIHSAGEIIETRPSIGSLSLEETGYYVMRSGWETDDCHMIISAGLSSKKPDHQHGEMLNITAYANKAQILPNYQVKYNQPDYPIFKNSWVKNVALVDSIPLGRGWIANRGGSGFGKWKNLPEPKVLAWIATDGFDYFSGSHNSYDSLNVDYFREILFVKDGFWIVRDHFLSNQPHSYQQIWQGKYEIDSLHNARAIFGVDFSFQIIQLNKNIYGAGYGNYRGKNSIVFESRSDSGFAYTTLLFPKVKPAEKMALDVKSKIRSIGNWIIFENPEGKLSDFNTYSTDARWLLKSNKNDFILLDAKIFKEGNWELSYDRKSSLVILPNSNEWNVFQLGFSDLNLNVMEAISINIDEQIMSVSDNERFVVSTGSKLKIGFNPRD